SGTAGRKLLSITARSPLLAYRVGRFALLAGGLMALATALDLMWFRDEEEDLPPEVRYRMHLILPPGRDSEGRVLAFTRLGSLQDFLEWFGADAPQELVRDWMDGRKGLGQVLKEMAIAPANKLYGGLTPAVKLPAELIY